ncbi:hypothetical protein LTS08_003439 [Lithohypha guttulata]|nr:hypothetical protein LTS08_003439 [Lithohypha guttulata]
MGSNDTRQLDGIGGATSTTSKAAIVSRSSTPGIDVEYTFAQVAVGKEVVDFSGNCGNIASGVGPFAIDQGMIEVGFGQKQVDIRILNTNTNVVIIETLQVDEHGCFEETGTHKIAGLASPGSEIKVAFTNPAGSMTGQLFPTGCKNDRLVIDTEHGVFDIDVTMIDSGNPFAFVDASKLPLLPIGTLAEALPLELLELVRQKAAVKMGLAPNIEMASLVRGTPKIAMVFPSDQGPRLFHRSVANSTASDIAVVALSMGKMHPTLQLTGAVALSSALCVEGTVPFMLSSRARSQESSEHFRNEQLCCIEHAGGCIHIDVVSQSDGQRVHVEKCTLSRTARTLFEGLVMCHV